MTRQPSMTFYSGKKPRAYPESQLQRAVIQFLKLSGAPNLIFFACPNGVPMARRTIAHQLSIGLLPGVADLVIVHDGQAMFLEIKAKGGKQQPSQIAFEKLCKANSSAYAVVDNINDAIKQLTAWGVISYSRKVA